MSAPDRLTAMLRDPECADELLLLGVALCGLFDLDIVSDRFRALERLVHRPPGGGSGWWAKDVIRRDARTYEPPWPGWAAPCEAPMIRRAGYCGNNTGGGVVHLQDYATGEQRPVKHCARHRPWAEDLQRDNHAEAPDPAARYGGAPLPAANHGGVLARHYPELDWPDLWLQVDPSWVEHPEGEPRPLPTFRLLIGDGDGDRDGDRGEQASRPVLTLAPAGRGRTPTGRGLR